MQSLKASVIIITYNRSQFLEKAISSVEAQTVKNFEVIVVDDCSKKSEAARNKIICKSRAHYIYLSEGRGAQYARNYGAKIARFEILCFLDDDDEFVERKIGVILRTFENNISIDVISNSFFVRRDKRKSKIIYTETKSSVDELLSDNTLGGCSMMSIRKKFFDDSEGFSEDLKSCQDWDFWIKASLIAPVLCLREPLTIYNIDDGNRVSSNFKKSFEGRKIFYEKYCHLMSKKTRSWNLFVLASLDYGAHLNPFRFFKCILLLFPTRRYITGGVIIASILKRIVTEKVINVQKATTDVKLKNNYGS